MGFKVLVIDETLGQLSFVKQLLEDLEQVAEVLVIRHPSDICLEDIRLDVFILGASWLDRARELRRLFPMSFIVGRGPWQGTSSAEFFPWGDALREPTLPITDLIPE